MKEYNINLSTDNFANVNTDIKIKQNDFNSALFLISCDVEFTSAILKFKLPGKSVIVSENYSLSDGIISYCIENSVLSEYGLIVCEVSYYKDNQRITTNTFTFEVVEEINANFSVKADNKMQILDSLITKTENILKTTKEISFNMPCETSNERCAKITDSIGIKKSLKIYGPTQNSKLIISDGNNMIKFLERDSSKINKANDYYKVIDNKIYVDNLIGSEITQNKSSFDSYFIIEPITLYKGVTYTVTTNETTIYPYIMLYDDSYKLYLTVSSNQVIVPEKDVKICYVRIWSNLSTAGMIGYQYNGFFDLGIYMGEYSLSTLPENTLETTKEIVIPQLSENSYIHVDNTSAVIFENNKTIDITKTQVGEELINFTFNKDKCFVYCTDYTNIEICYYEDIMKLLDKYQLKETLPIMMMSPRPQNNIITETIPD